jgi:hypothetical protein
MSSLECLPHNLKTALGIPRDYCEWDTFDERALFLRKLKGQDVTFFLEEFNAMDPNWQAGLKRLDSMVGLDKFYVLILFPREPLPLALYIWERGNNGRFKDGKAILIKDGMYVGGLTLD